MRTIVIGDVHGCVVELETLLAKVNYTTADALVFLGDLIHKGPAPNLVVWRINTLRKQNNKVVIIMGNHEEKQLRWFAKSEEERKLMEHTEGYDHLQPHEEEHAMLLNAPLYHSFESGGKKFFCVHGGITPSLAATLPQEAPNYFDLSNSDKKSIGVVLRLRYLSKKGPVQMGKEKEEDWFWADAYDGSRGHAFFGHQSFFCSNAREFPHATGLDLGCVDGNKLCAAIVEDGNITYETVDATKQYNEPIVLMKRVPQ
jgi:predicted phosphodiesterase